MHEGFVEVYATSTGRKQRVPAHYLDHPVLGADFRLTPLGEELLRQAEGPSLDWSLTQLQEHADALGVDRSGLRSKADTLAAIEAATKTPDPNNEGAPDQVDGTTTPTNNDGTPTVENQE